MYDYLMYDYFLQSMTIEGHIPVIQVGRGRRRRQEVASIGGEKNHSRSVLCAQYNRSSDVILVTRSSDLT